MYNFKNIDLIKSRMGWMKTGRRKIKIHNFDAGVAFHYELTELWFVDSPTSPTTPSDM